MVIFVARLYVCGLRYLSTNYVRMPMQGKMNDSCAKENQKIFARFCEREFLQTILRSCSILCACDSSLFLAMIREQFGERGCWYAWTLA